LLDVLANAARSHGGTDAAIGPNPGNEVPVSGTIQFKAWARLRENHAILSNQWFATGCVAFSGCDIRQNDRWETIDFYEGLRHSARIV
jgi:hypothetical protein